MGHTSPVEGKMRKLQRRLLSLPETDRPGEKSLRNNDILNCSDLYSYCMSCCVFLFCCIFYISVKFVTDSFCPFLIVITTRIPW